MNKQSILRRINRAFDAYLNSTKAVTRHLLPGAITAGKLYEAHVLAILARDLTVREGFRLQLVGGTRLTLKASPGAINTTYPHIECWSGKRHVADIWTDVEFTTLSYRSLGGGPLRKGHYHELDIVLVSPGTSGRPDHASLLLGVECKNTPYRKALLRETLGVRRELSLLAGSQSTSFLRWPRSVVPAVPSSCLSVFSTTRTVLDYADPGLMFGIDFNYEPLI